MRTEITVDRTLTFSHGESPADRWACVQTDPHPALADVVRLYQGYVGVSERPIRRRELPFGNVVLILNLGPPYRMVDPAGGGADRSSFVAGLHGSYVLIDNRGIDRCLHVDLTPLGAYRFLRVPMHHFANRAVELSDVLGVDADRLIARLHDTDDWPSRFAILDAALLNRMAGARPVSREVAWAWRQLEFHNGMIRIADIAGALGWSRKRLVAGFREQIGVPPKMLARVLRFHHARGLLGACDTDAAQVAATCGYADQAHMIREFRAISGWTPSTVPPRG